MSRKVNDYPEKLRLVHDEVDKHRARLAPRVRSVQNRAAILIGAAGIALAFLAAADPRTCLNWVSIVLSLGAAGCGIAAMVAVGQKGEEVGLPCLFHTTMAADDVYSAEWTIVDDKIKTHTSDFSAYKRRYRVLQIGFYALGASWVAAALSLM